LRHSRLIARGIILAAAALPWGCGRTRDDAGAGVAARVDSLVEAYRRETSAPGVSVAVIRGGRDTLVYRGYGLANVENDVPATPRTVYPIGSITKQFTAAAVLQLADRGRLSLDDSIGRHLPGVPDAWRGIRIHQLLNHTAGVPDYASIPRIQSIIAGELTPDSLIGLVRYHALEFEPGERWSYSNIGYTLLGMLVERASGQPYARYLESGIFRPLGMAATRDCDVTPPTPHRASGYQRRDAGVAGARRTSMSFAFGGGGLCSTVGDLAAWNRALTGGRVIRPASWARMTTPQGAAVPAKYGYGLWMRALEGHRAIEHGGGLDGFWTANLYLPDDSLSVTVLTNLDTGNPEDLARDIARLVLAASPLAAPGDSGPRPRPE
jgi:D-alanyl-D-alanine carboxypeptidase